MWASIRQLHSRGPMGQLYGIRTPVSCLWLIHHVEKLLIITECVNVINSRQCANLEFYTFLAHSAVCMLRSDYIRPRLHYTRGSKTNA